MVLNCTMKHNWFADITGRVGVVAVERSLIYLKGGVAWEGSNFSVGNSITGGGMSLAANASGSGTQTGGLLGMGVEYVFLPNWSAKFEYNYIDYGTRSFNPQYRRTSDSPGPDWLLFPECRCRLQSQRVSTSSKPA